MSVREERGRKGQRRPWELEGPCCAKQWQRRMVHRGGGKLRPWGLAPRPKRSNTRGELTSSTVQPRDVEAVNHVERDIRLLGRSRLLVAVPRRLRTLSLGVGARARRLSLLLGWGRRCGLVVGAEDVARSTVRIDQRPVRLGAFGQGRVHRSDRLKTRAKSASGSTGREESTHDDVLQGFAHVVRGLTPRGLVVLARECGVCWVCDRGRIGWSGSGAVEGRATEE